MIPITSRIILFFAVQLVCVLSTGTNAQTGTIMTVTGPVTPAEMGLSLIHEHVLVDFIGADQTGEHRWDKEEVLSIVTPYVMELKEFGVQTMVECTPAYLGRDPLLLKALSETTGVQIITNTGFYGASDNKHLPREAYTETVDQLAARWIKEAQEGIAGTGIKPGFIKISVNSGSLSELHRKLIRAAARTHLKTGLIIASHTGPAVPAFEQLAILGSEGVHPSAFIWVHVPGEADPAMHVKAAQQGAWVSLDNLAVSNLEEYADMLQNLKSQGLLHRVLLSHDAGWYSPGEEKGGDFRAYTALFKEFLPLLTAKGWTETEIQQLLIINPRTAFEIQIKALR